MHTAITPHLKAEVIKPKKKRRTVEFYTHARMCSIHDLENVFDFGVLGFFFFNRYAGINFELLVAPDTTASFLRTSHVGSFYDVKEPTATAPIMAAPLNVPTQLPRMMYVCASSGERQPLKAGLQQATPLSCGCASFGAYAQSTSTTAFDVHPPKQRKKQPNKNKTNAPKTTNPKTTQPKGTPRC